jgi:hypothetical protein
MNEQVLHKRIFKGWDDGIVVATAQLSQLGNQDPYFSVTTDNGCDHESILKALGHVPEVKLLVDLHLSDKDGTPMHALDNCVYYLTQQPRNFDTIKRHLRATDVEVRELIAIADRTEALRRDDIAPYIETNLKPRWKKEARHAIKALQGPTYVDQLVTFNTANQDPRTENLLRINSTTLPGKVCDNEVCLGTAYRYMVFANSEEAGKAAKEYWRNLAKDDPKEFTCLVGEETLVSWDLGRPAGPGHTQTKSLAEWLDLWLNTPEEHFASYDGHEVECEVSAALADALDIGNPEDKDWVGAVAYRC